MSYTQSAVRSQRSKPTDIRFCESPCESINVLTCNLSGRVLHIKQFVTGCCFAYNPYVVDWFTYSLHLQKMELVRVVLISAIVFIVFIHISAGFDNRLLPRTVCEKGGCSCSPSPVNFEEVTRVECSCQDSVCFHILCLLSCRVH